MASSVLDDGDGREWRRTCSIISKGRLRRGEVLSAMLLGLLKVV